MKRTIVWMGLAAVSVAIVTSAVSAQDLVGWWPFDETEGDTAADSSGSDHDGTLFGSDPQWFPGEGKFGGALFLPGDDEFVEVDSQEDFAFPEGQAFTVAVWYRSDLDDNDNGLITKGYSDDSRDNSYWMLQTLGEGFGFDSRCCDGGGTPRIKPDAGGDSDDDQWNHFVITRDQEAGEFRLYLNGEEALVLDLLDGGDWDMGANDDPVVIGNHFDRFTPGFFDDIGIWRRALTPDEIETIHASGIAALSDALLAFFNPSAATVPDGGVVTLRWKVSPGATVSISPEIGDVTDKTNAQGEGSVEVTLTDTTTFMLTASKDGDTEEKSATVTVPLLASFSADKERIEQGESVTLSWKVKSTASVSIDQGIGNVDEQTAGGSGTLSVRPAETADYTITATAGDNMEKRTVSISVLKPTADGLVAWWPFDETDGEVAEDATGSGHDGTLMGSDPQWEPDGGKFGGALFLPGDDEFVEIEANENFEFPEGQAFTLAVWYRSDLDDNDNGLITKGYADNSRDNNYWMLQTLGEGFGFDSRCCDGGGTPRIKPDAGGDSDDDEWNHVAAVRDQELGEFRLYHNGEETLVLNLEDGGDWDMGVNEDPVVIGNHFDRFTPGHFDDIGIWRRALTPEEILLILENGIAGLAGGGPAAFEIVSFGRDSAADTATITWNSRPGRTYAVETTEDLQVWLELSDGVESEGELTTFEVENVTTNARPYFRVREE